MSSLTAVVVPSLLSVHFLLNIVHQHIEQPLDFDLGPSPQCEAIQLFAVDDMDEHRFHNPHPLRVHVPTFSVPPDEELNVRSPPCQKRQLAESRRLI
jgi:hypothetical protein